MPRKQSLARLDSETPARKPAAPTEALPGSAEKIQVLQARAARREVLFHPQDATLVSSNLRHEFQRAKNNADVAVRVLREDGTVCEQADLSPHAFGSRLRKFRERFGWSKGELARRSGLTQPAVTLAEQGKRLPTLGALVALADAFGVGVDELLGRRVPRG